MKREFTWNQLVAMYGAKVYIRRSTENASGEKKAGRSWRFFQA